MYRFIWSGFRKGLKFTLLVIIVNIATVFILLGKPKYLHQSIHYEINSKNSSEVSVESEIFKYTGKPDMKYILLWRSADKVPFVYFGTGQTVFKDRKCKWNNCYITNDRGYLGYYTEFEAVLYSGPHLGEMIYYQDFPEKRSAHQKYVYANIESAAYYPIIGKQWIGFFNWTWTYKLDSDIRWGYFVIKNASNHIIGPSLTMVWINSTDMRPIDETLKAKLKFKTKAAAWFSSHCNTFSLRENFVLKIQEELQSYGLQVDTYGTCGKYQCPKENMTKCLQMLERDYYFYFAFENALSEDYVTEKLVYALKSNTVPVVYGGADYSRYMPDGIYLDALKLGPREVAHKMNILIKSPELYYDYFKWNNHYSYHFMYEDSEIDEYCRFCALLNDENRVKSTTVYEKVDMWWNSNLTFDTFEGLWK